MITRRTLMTAGTAAVLAGGAWYLSRPGAPGGAASGLLPGPAFAQETGAADGAEAGFEVIEMVQGDPEAPVEVIEYASFTCPHCASFHANQFKELKAAYIDTGRIRFVYREVYFDRPGLWASMVARCGGPDRFFGIADMIYRQQQDWGRSQDANYIVDRLMAMGKTAGLTDEALNACMRDADMAQTLVTWWEGNRDADDISSTPSFVIDGEKYSNMSFEDFSAILDEKLAAADG